MKGEKSEKSQKQLQRNIFKILFNVPVMEPVVALSEFGTCVAVHELASHDLVLLKTKAL